jgi:hypothetical protein
MTDLTIQLNGSNELVAIDPDTGDEIPVPFDSIKIDSGLLEADQIDATSITLENVFDQDIDSQNVTAAVVDGTEANMEDVHISNSVELPTASEGDDAPSTRAIAIDENTGELLIGD